MPMSRSRTVCWTPTWNKAHEGVGLEHLLLDQRAADSVVLAVDEERGPFRLTYRLAWDDAWRLREAELVVATDRSTQSLSLRTDGQGHWRHNDGRICGDLDGCLDVDIWPTPFTNSFPIRRQPMTVGERREFRMASISARICGSSRNRRPTRVSVNGSTFSRTWTAAASQLNFPSTKTGSYWTIRRCSGE